MFRYLVFAYDEYYPLGGMEDCRYKSNEPLAVRAKVRSLKSEWETVEVYDCVTDKVCYKYEEE